MTAEDEARTIADYWRNRAEMKHKADDDVAAARLYMTAARFYIKAGENAMAEASTRASLKLVPKEGVTITPAGLPPRKLKSRKRKAGDETKAPGAVRRQRVFNFICTYKAAHDGVAPSVREIGEACGLTSTSVVSYYLQVLQHEGLIDFRYNESRTIEVMRGYWRILPAPERT